MNTINISNELINFIKSVSWTFAKTYAKKWPHEYIVRQHVDAVLYNTLAEAISKFGYNEYFYDREVKYLDIDEHTYWHMGNVINRCIIADTYHVRKVHNRLPLD